MSDSGLIQRETNTRDIKRRAFEQGIARTNQIMTHTPKTLVFIDDPEDAEKCRRENPDAIVIIIVAPPRCEHKPCKSPDCNCPEDYRLRMAEELGFHAPSPTVH
jgi:hypothetical protein